MRSECFFICPGMNNFFGKTIVQQQERGKEQQEGMSILLVVVMTIRRCLILWWVLHTRKCYHEPYSYMGLIYSRVILCFNETLRWELIPYKFLLVVLLTIALISFHLWCMLRGSVCIWMKSSQFRFIEGLTTSIKKKKPKYQLSSTVVWLRLLYLSNKWDRSSERKMWAVTLVWLNVCHGYFCHMDFTLITIEWGHIWIAYELQDVFFSVQTVPKLEVSWVATYFQPCFRRILERWHQQVKWHIVSYKQLRGDMAKHMGASWMPCDHQFTWLTTSQPHLSLTCSCKGAAMMVATPR